MNAKYAYHQGEITVGQGFKMVVAPGSKATVVVSKIHFADKPIIAQIKLPIMI